VSAATVAGARGARLRARLPHLAFAVGAVVVAVGVILRRLTDYVLGAPWPPSLGNLEPGAHPLLAVSLACFAAAVVLAPRLLDERARPAVAAGALLAGTLVLRLALAAGRGGTAQWDRVFDEARYFEGANEYLPALASVELGTGFFIDRFAELVPSFPVHVAGHPPGLLLVMHAFGITTPAQLAALCIAVGALSAPLTYALARRLLDERGARLAGLLMALSPAALMFGVTSADAVYLTLGLLAAWPLASGSRRDRPMAGPLAAGSRGDRPTAGSLPIRPHPVLLVGAVVLAVVSLFAWSLLAVGAWAALLVLRRDGWRPALALAATCGVVLLAFHAAFWALTGFDAVGTIRATEEVYRAGVASMRPYWYWLLGSPVGFLLVLGLPIGWLALRDLANGSPEAIAIFAVLAIASVMGFTKAETERIWLFFAPFVCLAAARALAGRPGLVTPVVAALAAQAVLHELVFDTVW